MCDDRFDIEKLHSNFQASLKDSDDILLDCYLEGFKELYKWVYLNSSFLDRDLFEIN